MIYYCIGIKGAGMSTLANCLNDLGNEVIGYDDHQEYKFTEEGLIKRNIKINYGPSDIPKNAIVTYSKAFSESHPEIKRMHDLGYNIVDYNMVVGQITEKFKTIAINGTHGKTTITAMIAHTFSELIKLNYYIGDGTAMVDKNNEFLVIEADEYNKHFLAYHPTISITSNIEADHLECYKNGLDEIIDTFEIFNNKAELSIVNGDDHNIRSMNLKHRYITFGLDEKNDVYAQNFQMNNEGIVFDCFNHGNFYGHFELPFYGKHMLYNSLAIISLALELNIKFDILISKLKTFQGAHRRFKVTKLNDNYLIDDYAHHPSEIKATIAAAKQRFNNQKIISVFMPNTYSRTKDLFDDFVDALALSDIAYITPINSNREKENDYPGITSDKLVSSINNALLLNENNFKDLLKHHNSVILFMSCADISPLINRYCKEYNE
ncbi:MAG: Mur ligase family protein [Erysipelotrichaceae bacterium]|nr:Mur ligase family protein [Erysipelotrichaceae bacterium]